MQQENDKENDSEQIPSNVGPTQENSSSLTNRRESLSRGILKPQIPSDPESQGRRSTIHSFPLGRATDVVNTHSTQNIPKSSSTTLTSEAVISIVNEINQKTKKENQRRRVSFAPEVTMHKIDLIPVGSVSKLNQRLIKRRETIASLPHSVQTTEIQITHSEQHSQSHVSHIEEDDNNDDDHARKILVDSSDVEDEDSGEQNLDAQEGQFISLPHTEQEDEDRDMMLTMIHASQIHDLKKQSIKVGSDDNTTEQTMDLTQSLTFINRQMALEKFNQRSTLSLETEDQAGVLSQPTVARPFGNITALFDPDESGNQSNIEELDDQNMSDDMELTGKYDLRLQKENSAFNSEKNLEDEEEMDMDFTGKFQVNARPEMKSHNQTEDIAAADLNNRENVTAQAQSIQPNDEEVTMDFTHIFSNIDKIPTNEEEEEEQQQIMNDSANASEIDMDLTSLHNSVTQKKRQTRDEKMTTDIAQDICAVDTGRGQQDPIFDDNEDEEQSMEITQCNVNTENEEEDDDDELDDELTMMNTHLNRTIGNFIAPSQDILMTSTQLQGSQTEEPALVPLLTPSPRPKSTKSNAMSPPIVADKRSSSERNTSVARSFSPVTDYLTPIKPKRSHTTETGSPMSSKRKHSSDNDDILQQIKTKISVMTPKKRRRETSSEFQLVGSNISTAKTEQQNSHGQEEHAAHHAITNKYQQASEILVVPDPFVLEDEPVPPSFTPLREASNKRRSLTALDKIPFNLSIETAPYGTSATTALNTTSLTSPTTTKIPLADAHEQPVSEIVVDENYTPVTIQQFFKDLSIEFFGTLDALDQYQRAFEHVKYPDLAVGAEGDSSSVTSDLHYIIARSGKVPWLALSHFSCLEILKNLLELKLFFEKLESEFLQDNPNFVKEYYLAQSFSLQRSLSDHFILMKEYSDQIAEKKLLEWRDMLHQELVVGLNENGRKINEEIEKGNETLIKLERLEKQVVEVLKESNRELIILKEKLHDLDSSRSQELINSRLELSQELDFLTKEESQLQSLQEELSQLDAEIINNTELKQEIQAKEKYIKDHRDVNFQEKLRKDTEQFEWKLKLSGIKFIKLVNSTIHLNLTHSKIKISYDILNDSKRSVVIPQSIKPGLTRHVLEKFVEKKNTAPIDKFVQGLYTLFVLLSEFERDLFFLGTKFPVSVVHDQERGDIFQLHLLKYDRVRKLKYKLCFIFNLDHLLNNPLDTAVKPSNLECQPIFGTEQNNITISGLKNRFIQDNLEFGFIRQLA